MIRLICVVEGATEESFVDNLSRPLLEPRNIYPDPRPIGGVSRGYPNSEGLEKCNDPRPIAYIQLHEFEAILFADPSKLSEFYGKHKTGIVELIKMRERLAPEEIDEGENTAPSKRILRHIPEYNKVLGGVVTARAIGIEKIRQERPHFNGWISKLEALGE